MAEYKPAAFGYGVRSYKI